MRLPKTIKARPALQGLVVDSAGSSDEPSLEKIYPWDRVGLLMNQGAGVGSIWAAYAEDGNRAEVAGRALQLSLPTERVTRVADRAQTRFFRRAWRRGELAHEQPFVFRRFEFWFWALLPTAYAAMMFVFVLHDWEKVSSLITLPIEYRALSLTVCALILIGALVILAGPAALAIMMMMANVRHCRFDRMGVKATLKNGQEVAAEWSVLRQHKRTVRLTSLIFADGPVLRFDQLDPRARMLPKFAEAEFLPEAATRKKSADRRLAVRIGLYWVAATVIGLLVTSQFVPHASGKTIALVLAQFVAVGAMGCVLILIQNHRWKWWARLRRRRRRMRRPPRAPRRR